MNRLTLDQFTTLAETRPVLDVRSPIEFEQGHLPNAMNMPLLSDEERVEVGTLYKQVSPQVAFKRGLDFIGPKMSGMITFVEDLNSHELLVHCWRGGNRSQSVAMLLESYGFKVSILKGGYKTYRQAALRFFNQPLPLLVLTGCTGSLKTEVLHALAARGEQVVDLEGIACHQGSTFGRQGQEQPTGEQFQNNLYEAFLPLDLNRRIWLEDESMRIGQVSLVEELYQQKNKAPMVLLDMGKELRIRNLVKNYGQVDKSYLIRATQAISKKLGRLETEMALGHIESQEPEAAASVLLEYYDRQYRKSIERKKKQVILTLEADHTDPELIADQLLASLNKHF